MRDHRVDTVRRLIMGIMSSTYRPVLAPWAVGMRCLDPRVLTGREAPGVGGTSAARPACVGMGRSPAQSPHRPKVPEGHEVRGDETIGSGVCDHSGIGTHLYFPRRPCECCDRLDRRPPMGSNPVSNNPPTDPCRAGL